MVEQITTISSVVITAVSIIIAVIQTIKKGKKCKSVELAKVVQKIPEYITEAEQIIGASKGVAKLQYVLNKIQLQCQINGINYTENQFKYEIEKILETPQKKQIEKIYHKWYKDEMEGTYGTTENEKEETR